jgi:predicted RNase H-like nuclease (RuvC/YqgF family)
MPESNDHDLLVRLDAKVEMLITSQTSFIQASTATTKELAERIARLEVKDSKDSEKVASITADVQRSLNNSMRITDAFVSIENLRIDIATMKAEKINLQNELNDLKKKSNLFDIVNGLGVAIAAAVGWNR